MLATVSQLEVKSFPKYADVRGLLIPVELAEFVSFPVVRFFWIMGVPAQTVRGGHAHKRCNQFMVCVAGSITVEAFDGHTTRRLQLAEGEGIHVPPGIFGTETFEAANSILLVLCDRPYESDDYLADHASLMTFRAQA